MTPQRILLVHAHPDDEALWTGTVIAHHVDAGDVVVVVTCTLGEEGEVIPAELAHLEGAGDALAEHRLGELAASAEVLGFRSRLLGEQGARPAYRDSGMAGTPPFDHPRAFANRDPREPGALLAQVLREERPDVVVTYDPNGGYLHPDHVQAHRATVAALNEVAAEGLHSRLLLVVVPRSWAQEDRAWVAANVEGEAPTPEHVRGSGTVILQPGDPYPPSVVDDALVTHRVEHPSPRKEAAFRAHPTQVTVHDGWYALSNDVAARLTHREALVEADPLTGIPLLDGTPLAVS